MYMRISAVKLYWLLIGTRQRIDRYNVTNNKAKYYIYSSCQSKYKGVQTINQDN